MTEPEASGAMSFLEHLEELRRRRWHLDNERQDIKRGACPAPPAEMLGDLGEDGMGGIAKY